MKFPSTKSISKQSLPREVLSISDDSSNSTASKANSTSQSSNHILLQDNCPIDLSFCNNWINNPNQTISQLSKCKVIPKEKAFLRFHLRTSPKSSFKFHPKLSHLTDPFYLLNMITLGEWLNDSIINSFMQLFNEKKQLHKINGSIYFHKTSLYEYVSNDKLNKLEQYLTCPRMKSLVSLPFGNTFWDYDLHLVPINHDNRHWSLCVLDTQQHLIYHLDSIASESRDKSVYYNIMNYVDCEYMKRFPKGDNDDKLKNGKQSSHPILKLNLSHNKLHQPVIVVFLLYSTQIAWHTVTTVLDFLKRLF